MPKTKFNYAMNDAEIEAGIKSIGTRTKDLREDTHKICVSVLKAWAKNNDASTAAGRASAILGVVDKYKAQAIVDWFSVYAGFEYDAGEEHFSYTKTKIEVETVQKAQEEPYWQLSPARPAKPFNLPDRIKNLVQAAQSKRKKGVTDEDDIPQDMLEALSAIAEGAFHMEETE